MLEHVLIIRREDLSRPERDLPIGEINFLQMLLGMNRSLVLSTDLILFVDHQNGNGQIKVVKARGLAVKRPALTCVPPGTIIPSDLFDDLVCGELDLTSPRVQLPKEKP